MVLEDVIKTLSREIHIPAEIEKWRSAHGKNPTIVVDLKELSRLFAKIDEGGLILGGRFNLINNLFDYFFKEIQKCHVNLVFMASLDEDRFKDIDQFSTNFDAFDCIKNQQSLKVHLDNLAARNASTVRPSERILYNLLSLCKNYGQLHVNYGLGKRALLAYAREYRKDVLSIMTRNPELLCFDDDFQYWNLLNVKFNDLKIAFVSRQSIKEALGLNSLKMQVLFALSQLKPTENAQSLLDYVKQLESERYEDVLSRDLAQSQHAVTTIDKHLKELWTLSNYTGPWNEDIYSDAISNLRAIDADFRTKMQFCKQNIPYVYKLLNEILTVQKDMLFVDLRASNSIGFIYLMVCMLLKMCGIAFEFVAPIIRPKTRIVYQGYDRFDGVAVHVERDIFYPYSDYRTDLVVNEDEDEAELLGRRLAQFVWTTKLDFDFVRKVINSAHTNQMRVVLLTLEFLQSHDLITVGEADIISLTKSEEEAKRIANMNNTTLPPPSMPNDQYPSYARIPWVLLAHKYTITFELICHCLELCGMRKTTTPIWFDAFKFHENMYQAVNCDADYQNILQRIQNIRLQ